MILDGIIKEKYMQKDNICRPIIKQGLSSFQIKVIALVCMTLDHLAAFGFDIPIFEQYYTLLRTIGRIAAPLFLFILVQGAQNTRNRKRFILRLYLAGMGCGLFVTATNFFFGETVGFFTPGNILFTFFYVVLYIELIEKLCNKIRCQSREVFGYVIVIVAVTVGPHILNQMICEVIPEGISIQRLFLFQGLTDSFFPSIFRVEYSWGFVLLGIILYFMKTQKRQNIIFALFCLLCVIGRFAVLINPDLYMSIGSFGTIFFDSQQCWMLLALPFMMLYNGQRGRKCKWFFYWYYPVHRFLIAVISALLT